MVKGGAALLIATMILGVLMDGIDGSIVNVASVWGETGGSCEVGYSASKAAVIAATKKMARELISVGIRVNALAPEANELWSFSPSMSFQPGQSGQ